MPTVRIKVYLICNIIATLLTSHKQLQMSTTLSILIRHFIEARLAHDILQHPLQRTTTHYCIHTFVALIRI